MNQPASSVIVAADPATNDALRTAAARLSGDLLLPLVEDLSVTEARFRLVVTPTGLEIRLADDPGRPVWVDLSKVDTSSSAGARLDQPLFRALGIKRKADLPINVIDATAGWGEDSWMMARVGCEVLSVERDAVAATLLRDGLLRAASVDGAASGRMRVIHADARVLLGRLSRGADELDDAALCEWVRPFAHSPVVYLDPMYPGPRKTAERKPLKVLRELVGSDDDADELFDLAMCTTANRVVVKRPLRGEPLAGEPHHSHRGKAVRYDVYLK